MPAWVCCRAEENHHQERPNLDIPPQLSLEEELPSGGGPLHLGAFMLQAVPIIQLGFAVWSSLQGQSSAAASACLQAALASSGSIVHL